VSQTNVIKPTKNIAYHITGRVDILCRQNHGDGQF